MRVMRQPSPSLSTLANILNRMIILDFACTTENTIMKINKRKLTLCQPTTYQIKVLGVLDEKWSDWSEGMRITVESDEAGLTVTTLTGVVDQATLQGLLRRLYSLGLPLISVIWVETK